MKKKVLWVSLCAPYDKVPHAGGQIHNYYLKKLIKNDNLNVKLITYCKPDELPKLDYKKYKIDANVIVVPTQGIEFIKRKIMNFESRINPFNRYAGFTTNQMEYEMCKCIKELVNVGYEPDIIILEWTQMILMIKHFKSLFPNARYICIEEDVTFLGYRRKYELKKTWFNKIRYKKMKRIEIKALKLSDQIICNNTKDIELLNKEGIRNNIWCWHPYFHNMQNIKRTRLNNDILFFGAMNRRENYLSAIWFIQKVLPNLKIKDYRFVILGSKPPIQLLKYASDKIIIPGFVNDINPYFENSRCFVAPLLLGAGIKIKILEAFSSGIPVVTNHIGIEGIYARNNKDFILSEKPEDYINAIETLFNNESEAELIGKNGQKFVVSNFNYLDDVKIFNSIVETGNI